MSNYNTQLQANNADLQAILDALNALVNAGSVTLINFTIEGISYQAEEGMTWAEWVDSEYNTDGYYIELTTVNNPYNDYFVAHSLAGVSLSDVISNGTEYDLQSGGAIDSPFD